MSVTIPRVRLWTLHPRYLDARGLVALWREALLAQAVLQERTRGYRNHPQLERFREHASPALAIGAYLAAVAGEATARGYRFDAAKIDARGAAAPITASHGQRDHEWRHLMHKLKARDPARHARWDEEVRVPDLHPLFIGVPGPIAPWERVTADGERPRPRAQHP